MKEDIAETKAVLEKHGLIKSNVGADDDNSVILFGDGKQQEKKRNLKKSEKDELKSVRNKLCNRAILKEVIESNW